MDPEELASLEQRFLREFNPSRDPVVARSKSIKAAVQHNQLYAPHGSPAQRRAIRGHWSERLLELARAYRLPRDYEAFESDFLGLRNDLNAAYRQLFRDDDERRGYDGGFRISHAQKSLSVYLKHLWCMGEITMPPCCPVDRLILKSAGAPLAGLPWTHVNNLGQYRHHLGFIRERAERAGLSLAEWELRAFPD